MNIQNRHVTINTILLSIKNLYKGDKVKISKLGQGLPVGGEIEQFDDGTLISAFRNRGPVSTE